MPLFRRSSKALDQVPPAEAAALAPPPPPVKAEGPPPKKEEPPPAAEEPEEPPPDNSVVAAFKSELDTESAKLGDAVQEAHMKKREIENTIAAGDKKLANTKRDFTAKLDSHATNTDQIKAHQAALDTLMKTLERESTASRNKAGEQKTAAKRLKEEHTNSCAATIVARATCADARRLLAEAIAAGKADIAKADDTVCRVEAEAAMATEALQSVRAAGASLADRIGTLVTKTTAAQRELEFHNEAAAKLAKEHEASKETVHNAKDGDIAAKAALASHKRDAGRRVRAREAEVMRTRGRAATANKLRDLKLRGALATEDRDHFAPRGDAAHAAAQAAADAVSRAEQGRDATRNVDDEKLAELVAAENKASTNLNQRLRVTASLAERLLVRDDTVREARKVWAAADAAVTAAKEELALLEARADGPLTEASREAEKNAEEARRAAAEARRQAAEEELPLRHNAEAEEVVVMKQEEAEIKLRDALAVSQLSAAEAEADADAALDEQKATAAAAEMVANTPAPAQSDLLVLADARRRLEDREAEAVQARELKGEGEKALAEAREELAEESAKPMPEEHEPEEFRDLAVVEDADLMPGSKGGPDSEHRGNSARSMSMSYSSQNSPAKRRNSSAASRVTIVGRMAALEAAVDEREISLHLALAEVTTAEAAVLASKEELAALEKTAKAAEDVAKEAKEKLEAASAAGPDARLPATTPWATASLIREEKGAVDERLARHADLAGEFSGAISKAESEWTAEKEKLKADLHLAEMHLKQVNMDAEHHKELRAQT